MLNMVSESSLRRGWPRNALVARRMESAGSGMRMGVRVRALVSVDISADEFMH